ncbi:cupin domain-containing protein [Croceiramulus getboli]|nr:cupin domain-containing protein [Flavobacteriaceae bacterium YJPT1-3]
MAGYQIQRSPFVVPTTDGKYIGEHWGLATDGNQKISIAHMKAPAGWSEPFQTPEFEEYTLVVSGRKQVEVKGEKIVLMPGESIKIEKNTRVRYSNPFTEPCEYIAICTPAFQLEQVHREED